MGLCKAAKLAKVGMDGGHVNYERKVGVEDSTREIGRAHV